MNQRKYSINWPAFYITDIASKLNCAQYELLFNYYMYFVYIE